RRQRRGDPDRAGRGARGGGAAHSRIREEDGIQSEGDVRVGRRNAQAGGEWRSVRRAHRAAALSGRDRFGQRGEVQREAAGERGGGRGRETGSAEAGHFVSGGGEEDVRGGEVHQLP